jgi:PAS domain S-box-containing protein
MSLTAGASGLPIRSKEPSSLGEKLRATLSQRHTVWGQMALLVAGVVLPITLLWACCLWLQYRDDRARIESDLIEQARSAALLVDREFDLALNVAEMLAGAPSLKHGDVGEYRDYVHHAESLLTASYEGSRVPVAINVYDRDGRRLLNAGLSNAPPGDNAAQEVVGAAIASGRNQISNYFVGRFSGQPRVAVVAVVPRDPALATAPPDGLPAAISIALPREHLLAIAMSASRSPGVVTAIRDRNGIAVARSERDGGFFGKPPPTAGLFQGLQGAALIQRPVARPNGTPVVLAAARAPRSGYILALSVDEPVLLAPLRASLLRSAAGGAVALLAGIALAVILASRVSRALHRVLPAAEHAALEERTPEGTGLHDADLLAATLAGHLTERRRAALALLASESRFRTIAEAMPQMVWSATPEGAIEYCNARMLAGTGLTLEQVRAGALWEVVHPEDRAYTMAQWGRSLATGEPYEVEYRLRMADGSYRWMLRRALPVRDAAGEIERWVRDLHRHLGDRGRARIPVAVARAARGDDRGAYPRLGAEPGAARTLGPDAGARATRGRGGA